MPSIISIHGANAVFVVTIIISRKQPIYHLAHFLAIDITPLRTPFFPQINHPLQGLSTIGRQRRKAEAALQGHSHLIGRPYEMVCAYKYRGSGSLDNNFLRGVSARRAFRCYVLLKVYYIPLLRSHIVVNIQHA